MPLISVDAEAGRSEFEASLVYRAMQRNSVSDTHPLPKKKKKRRPTHFCKCSPSSRVTGEG